MGATESSESGIKGRSCADISRGAAPVRYVSKESPVVIIRYDDLVNNVDLSLSIEAAYCPSGLGLICVEDIPGVEQLRRNLLPLGRKFADLPVDVRTKYEHKESHYNFGWSHGKEIFVGKPDLAKGSFYANPLYNDPFPDPKLQAEHPSFACPNIWPKAEMPELETSFMAMGKKIADVSLLLATHCDNYVKGKCPSYKTGRLNEIIRDSRTPKGRLLHYFPVAEDGSAPKLPSDGTPLTEADYASWCGWHNDHGSLTGLVPAMYFNAEGKEVGVPDKQAGLYIRSRQGTIVKASLPGVNSLGFQVGEAQQIHSGGFLMATPHCVMGSSTPGVSRETFAMFMEPEWPEAMNPPSGIDYKNTIQQGTVAELPKGVPPLSRRWREGQDFGLFTKVTLEAYDVDMGGGGMGSVAPPAAAAAPTS